MNEEVEKLACFIMEHFHLEGAQPGFIENQAKLASYMNQEDQKLLPDAVKLLVTRGHITISPDPKDPSNNFLTLTEEGYNSLSRLRDTQGA
jgi:hypothetical protein